MLQGSAVVIPAYPEDQDLSQMEVSGNEGKPIRYLVSAPTMRIPTDVSKTVNSYLAFRAILRAGQPKLCESEQLHYSYAFFSFDAVKEHNLQSPDKAIKTVLCPGLGTAVGCMPVLTCATQMAVAYRSVMFGDVEAINQPAYLGQCCSHHFSLNNRLVTHCIFCIAY